MPHNSPKVSVILPTRNRAHLLGRAIASVLGQTHRNLELIVVNDASSDGTAGLLAAITDPRVRVIHRMVNTGAAAARNAGIELARGEWIAFQDDDDFWLAEKLEKQMAAVTCPARVSDWCICGCIRLEERRCEYVGGPWYASQLDYTLGIGDGGPNWSLIATPGWLIRRSALLEVGLFDERIRSWDDWELGLRLWQRIGLPLIVDEPLWCQDWELGGGLTRAEAARANDMLLMMKLHRDVWSPRRRVMARHWYVAGRHTSLHQAAPAGREQLWDAVYAWPLHFRAWAAIAMSYLGQERAHALTIGFRKLKNALK